MGYTLAEHLLFSTIQYVIMLFFNTYVLDLSWQKKQLITIVCIIFLPTYLLFPFFGAMSTLYYLSVLAIMVYRKTKVVMHVVHIFMSIIFLVICDNLSSVITFHLLELLHMQQLMSLGYIFFLIFFSIICAIVYKRIRIYTIDRWILNQYVSYILIFLSISTVVFIYINIMAIDHDNFYESVQNNLAMFLVYLALLAMSMFVVLYLAFKQYKMKQREQEMQNFESYVASLEQINQDMRRFKHDYINILSSLRIFIDDRNYDGLHKYFYNHILEANHHEQLNQQAMMMLNNLKMNSLKGLLTTKILQAQSHQVPFYIEVVEEISDIPVEPIILNRMVGIVLDNAIEAAREVEKGEVRVAFIRLKGAVLLVVTNTYDKEMNLKVHEIYQEGFSTKGDNRGLGLANLRLMINGLQHVNLNTRIRSPYFIQEVEFRKEYAR